MLHTSFDQLLLNSWLHRAVTYSLSTDLLLYVNSSPSNNTKTVVSCEQSSSEQDRLKIILCNPKQHDQLNPSVDLSQLCKDVRSQTLSGILPYTPPYENFNGIIDDFRFYCSELSKDDIIELIKLF